jgi:hypothetical protein
MPEILRAIHVAQRDIHAYIALANKLNLNRKTLCP